MAFNLIICSASSSFQDHRHHCLNHWRIKIKNMYKNMCGTGQANITTCIVVTQCLKVQSELSLCFDLVSYKLTIQITNEFIYWLLSFPLAISQSEAHTISWTRAWISKLRTKVNINIPSIHSILCWTELKMF